MLDIPLVENIRGIVLSTSFLEATARCWYEFDLGQFVNLSGQNIRTKLDKWHIPLKTVFNGVCGTKWTPTSSL